MNLLICLLKLQVLFLQSTQSSNQQFLFSVLEFYQSNPIPNNVWHKSSKIYRPFFFFLFLSILHSKSCRVTKRHSLHLKSSNIEQNFEPIKFYCRQGHPEQCDIDNHFWLRQTQLNMQEISCLLLLDTCLGSNSSAKFTINQLHDAKPSITVTNSTSAAWRNQHVGCNRWHAVTYSIGESHISIGLVGWIQIDVFTLPTFIISTFALQENKREDSTSIGRRQGE